METTPSSLTPHPPPQPPCISRLLRTLFFAVTATALLILCGRLVAVQLTFNLTSSMPVGLYWLSPVSVPVRGAVVDLPVPETVRSLIQDRAYLPPWCHLLKRVVAVAGDYVCTADGFYVVNDQLLSFIATHDLSGRPLPAPFPFCGTVPLGFAFLAAAGASSIDSRYFGPLPLVSLTTVVPLWTSY